VPPARIVVLITSYGRRKKTPYAFTGQRGLPAKVVRVAHPEVDATTVGTDLYRNQGMRIASRNSRPSGDPTLDYRLWLNHDVSLEGDTLAVLLDTAHTAGPGKAVVGAVRASDGGSTTTYPGRCGRAFAVVEPTGRPEPCDTHNGNAGLSPRTVCERVGGLGTVGVCDRNPPHTGSREPGMGAREALRRVASPRELPPRQWWVYCLRHCWPWAPLLMFSPYVKTAARASVRRSPAGG
jgi:hypothetical protein